MPPRKRKTPSALTAETLHTAAPSKKRAARWRWMRGADGQPVAERIDDNWQRSQADADLYGNTPMLSTGAHMRPISSILTELVSKYDVHETELAPELLAQAWHNAVGSFLSTQAELVSLSNGQATIRTLHPAVRFELQRHRKDLINALNKTLGEGCVRTVRIVHG